MKNNKLSVTIITLNEEKYIGRCLDSVKDIAYEIIVVDSGSVDKTVEIAKKYGAKVYTRKFDNYANQKNYALSKAIGEWVFSIDADEVATKDLRSEIVKAIQNKEVDGYLIPRRNIIFGKEIKHTRWSPDKHIWLWRRKKGNWSGKVHEEVTVEGKIGELKSPKIHYQYKNVSEFFQMMNRYSELEAVEIVETGDKFSLLKLFITPLDEFFRRYLYKKGFLDGWHGFILSYLMAIYKFAVWVKVWERQKVRN